MKQNILVIILVSTLMGNVVFAQYNKGFDYYYQTGNHLLSLKDSANRAIVMFDSAIALNAGSADAYIGRGTAKINNNRPVEGIKDYDTAILVATYKDKLKFFELKEAALTEGRFVPILARLDTRGGNFIVNGGMKLGGLNAFNPIVAVKKFFSKEQIKGVYDEAITLFPDSASAYVDRADYYHKNKEFANAIKDIRMAINLKPISQYYILLACTMYNSGDYSDRKIEHVLNHCIRRNPKDWNSYNYRAMLFSFRNLPDRAIEDYNKAIKIHPNAASYYSRAETKKGLPTKYTPQDIQRDYNNADLLKDK